MTQFDVHETRGIGPYSYVIILQSSYIVDLNTVIAAPLIDPKHAQRLPSINPVIALDGIDYSIRTELMFSVQAEILGAFVTNAEAMRYEIMRSVDIIFTGF